MSSLNFRDCSCTAPFLQLEFLVGFPAIPQFGCSLISLSTILPDSALIQPCYCICSTVEQFELLRNRLTEMSLALLINSTYRASSSSNNPKPGTCLHAGEQIVLYHFSKKVESDMATLEHLCLYSATVYVNRMTATILSKRLWVSLRCSLNFST